MTIKMVKQALECTFCIQNIETIIDVWHHDVVKLVGNAYKSCHHLTTPACDTYTCHVIILPHQHVTHIQVMSSSYHTNM